MIKLIKSYNNINSWHLNPGLQDGNVSSTKPYYWNAICNDDKLTCEVSNENSDDNSFSRVFIKVLLKSGVSYTIGTTNGSEFGNSIDTSLWIKNPDDTLYTDKIDQDGYGYINGVYCTEGIVITPSEDGIYTVCPGNYSGTSILKRTVSINPAPEDIIGNPYWEKKNGVIKSSRGWNKKTGKVFSYRSLKNAYEQSIEFLPGIMYFDTDDFNTFSSTDVKNNYFKNGPIIVQRNLNLGDGESTLISGYSDYFCEKFKGYIYISEAGSYRFVGTSDNSGMLKIDDHEQYILLDVVKDYFTIDLDVGYHLIEYYHGEEYGGQISEVYWYTPGSSSYASIPASVLFYSFDEYNKYLNK